MCSLVSNASRRPCAILMLHATRGQILRQFVHPWGKSQASGTVRQYVCSTLGTRECVPAYPYVPTTPRRSGKMAGDPSPSRPTPLRSSVAAKPASASLLTRHRRWLAPASRTGLRFTMVMRRATGDRSISSCRSCRCQSSSPSRLHTYPRHHMPSPIFPAINQHHP